MRDPWGMLTYSPLIVAASVKVLEESATPDVQVTVALALQLRF